MSISEAYIFHRTPTHEYRVSCVICGNAETVAGRLDAHDSDQNDNCTRLVQATGEAWAKALGLYGAWDVDSHFPNWHGGRYSHQAKMCGWEPGPGLSVVRVEVSPLFEDEDGDDLDDREWATVKITDLPAEVRAKIEAAIKAGDEAYSAEVTAIEAEALDAN